MAGSPTTVVVAVTAVLAVMACATPPAEHGDQRALVEAERAFARHAEATDVRTAFLAAFADDGIWIGECERSLRPPLDARRPR